MHVLLLLLLLVKPQQQALSVTRSEEFSPVKNAPGNPVDSPDSARQIFSTLHSGWLTAAGASIEAGEGLVEVSAIVSLSGEGLEAFDGMSLKRPLLVRGASEAAAAAATGAATGAAGADDGAGGAGGGAGAAAGDAVTHSVNGYGLWRQCVDAHAHTHIDIASLTRACLCRVFLTQGYQCVHRCRVLD